MSGVGHLLQVTTEVDGDATFQSVRDPGIETRRMTHPHSSECLGSGPKVPGEIVNTQKESVCPESESASTRPPGKIRGVVPPPFCRDLHLHSTKKGVRERVEFINESQFPGRNPNET